jgi:NADP-dependent 3-hydroxy acid dehydrogenase YdfG
MSSPGTAVITGASSGIGAAAARALAAAGYSMVLGARRVERLTALAAEIGPTATAHQLDVTDPVSVEAFTGAIPECRVLVNSAGGALGMETIGQADEALWQSMYDTNVLGTLRMTRALLPKLVASGDGMVITIGSVAAFEPYAGGGGYNAAKHATRALMDVLRLELVGQPIRVSEIDPGLVETEFSLVRFGGDEDRAGDVYRGITPLSADDVSEVIAFVATRPSNVDIDTVVIRPRDQARVWLVHREPSVDGASGAERSVGT